jgi:hypothetical protein
MPRSPLTWLALLAAALALAPAAPAASAQRPPPSGRCHGGAAPSLAALGDPGCYRLAPGGDFEHGAHGWLFASGASLAAESEPWQAAGPGTASLALGAHGSVALRVGPAAAGARLFVRDAGAAGARLRVDALARARGGGTITVAVATLTAGSAWQLAPPLSWAAPAGTTVYALRLTALGGGGAWRIDDVLVGPLR